MKDSLHQVFEGKLKICKREKCEYSCCNDDEVQEWVIEFLAFHERLKDFLKKQGINIIFTKDRVFFKNCSDGHQCKFLKNTLNKDIDPRPIDCKIYPFTVDWETIDFDKKIVNLYYWDNECPLIKKKIPQSFKKKVENILKRDFAFLFYGINFEIKFIDKILKRKKNAICPNRHIHVNSKKITKHIY
jgi:hypothetical protein